MNPLWPGLLAAGVSLALTPMAARAARRLGIVDHPGPLKPQERAVPYMGGVAVTLGFVAGALLAHLPVLVLPPVAAMALGLADDRFDLPVGARVAGEAAIGVGVALAAHVGSAWLVVVAVGATLGAVNGVNLIDGLDGLASGVVGASAVGFVLLGGGHLRLLAVPVVGALAGFLVFNRPPARIYLGDAGSYMLGTVLAELLVLGWRAHAGFGPAGLVLLGYPFGELIFSVVRRRRAHRPLFQGDRDHTYDRLVKRGWPVARVSLACTAAAAALAGAGIGLSRLSTTGAWTAAAAVGVVTLCGAARTGLLNP